MHLYAAPPFLIVDRIFKIIKNRDNKTIEYLNQRNTGDYKIVKSDENADFSRIIEVDMDDMQTSSGPNTPIYPPRHAPHVVPEKYPPDSTMVFIKPSFSA